MPFLWEIVFTATNSCLILWFVMAGLAILGFVLHLFGVTVALVWLIVISLYHVNHCRVSKTATDKAKIFITRKIMVTHKSLYLQHTSSALALMHVTLYFLEKIAQLRGTARDANNYNVMRRI